ncbi:hypothetical protein LTR62_004150 [Meristemomyces frigidus]|uniref:Pre-rRNA-processing protein TSR2 n=1 Tax=Meristemomyces frigidus TaxID=1508187 RepID=A0AAN7YSH3_9PEZI|nr:hypothetical protein LTR62_004150 [Meristemomyces frigidus]
MSTINQPGPLPTGGVPLPPTPEKLQQSLDHGIWYSLSLWPALHVAVQNNWGGPASDDKKDWFAGVVSDYISAPATQDLDQDDLEAFLLQVMQDEFDCNVEDESEVVVAGEILGLRRCLKGEIEGVSDRLAAFKELERRYRNRGQMKTNIQVIDNGAQEEAGNDEDLEGFGDGEGDVDMTAGEEAVPNLAPAVVKPRKERVEPEVDDDGFQKVTRKR